MMAMLHPEVILDRFIKAELCHRVAFSGYVGKLDIERLESPQVRSLLYSVQDALNEALRRENVNASGGVEHAPFHFDYIDVDRNEGNPNEQNALAFQHGGFSFIVVTLPMVELLWEVSRLLSRSQLMLQLLGLEAESVDLDLVQRVLFQIQLGFLVSHEYTHHVHRHCTEAGGGAAVVWAEFLPDERTGSLDSQAQELDADAYAAYLTLSHLVCGDWRQSVLSQLGRGGNPTTECDESLLTIFFLAVMAFFCALWREGVNSASVYRTRHPSPPVRITFVIRVAEMWCGQFGSIPRSWFTPARFQELFRTASGVIGAEAKQSWDVSMSFLRSPEGAQYDERLLDRFEAIRKGSEFVVP